METEFQENEKPISIGQWMLNLFITYIPMVNLIMYIVWAASSETPPTKKNWAIAKLLWLVIGGVLLAVSYGAIIALLLASGAFDNM